MYLINRVCVCVGGGGRGWKKNSERGDREGAAFGHVDK